MPTGEHRARRTSGLGNIRPGEHRVDPLLSKNKHKKADYYKEFSAIYEHCNVMNHELPSYSNVEILGKDAKWYKRKIKESLFIQKYKPDLNRNIKSFDCKLF